MSNYVKHIMQSGQDFIAENLTDCCKELLIWHNTGILPAGKLRDASRIFLELNTGNHLNIAENITRAQALEFVATHTSAKETT